MNLIWTENAHSDWEGIAAYIIDKFGEQGFVNFDKATDEAELQVLHAPNSGTPLLSRRHKSLGLRYVLVHKLSKMIYHVDGDTIYVDVFWDVRQDPKRLAKRLANL